MKVEKVDRVVIAVKDIENAQSFFSKILGIKFDKPVNVEGEGMRAAYSPLGIELVEPTQSNSDVAKFINKNGEGFYGMVLKVDNLDVTLKKLKKEGIKPVNKINLGELKEAVFHPSDTYNTLLILCEYSEDYAGLAAQKGE